MLRRSSLSALSALGIARVLLASAVVLTGCNALIDVRDIYLDTDGGDPTGTDGSTDGNVTPPEGGSVDGGADAPATCNADLQTDVNNCGRCAHSCGGGACTVGVCQPLELVTVAQSPPLFFIAVSPQHVFASARVRTFDQRSGVWRTPKNGGAAELYANLRYAEAMAVLGNKLYFIVSEDAENGADRHGGFYSCALNEPAPCTPTLIAAADNPNGLTVDKGAVYYGDSDPMKGLMQYTPAGGAPTLFRPGYGSLASYFIDGAAVFYSVTFTSSPYRAAVLEVFPDAGFAERYSYTSATADDGQLIGSPDALLFTAYDFSNTTGGIVRRIPRAAGVAPCDLGGSGNKRPYGIHADGARVYWTNQGVGAAPPYTGGSVVSCPAAGCCAVPETLWTGDGQPTAMAGDADAIYWVNQSKGSIWKVAKP